MKFWLEKKYVSLAEFLGMFKGIVYKVQIKLVSSMVVDGVNLMLDIT